MNQIQRLFNNIKTYIEAGVLDAEFAVFAEENPNLDSIEELNEIMESEMSYGADDCMVGEATHG